MHVSAVGSGLGCGCACAGCGGALVARKGAVREHHFAHHDAEPCRHAVETALHLAAKSILEQELVITLPALRVTFDSYKDDIELEPATRHELESVRLEQRVDDLVPDVIARIGGHDLWVEVFVTHRVDESKRRKMRERGVSGIEIDLSGAGRDLSWEALRPLVVEGVENKRWLHSVRVEREYRRMLAKAQRRPTIQRGCAVHVDHCPIRAREYRGKPYANFIDDCIYCKHCLAVRPGNQYIQCDGHLAAMGGRG